MASRKVLTKTNHNYSETSVLMLRNIAKRKATKRSKIYKNRTNVVDNKPYIKETIELILYWTNIDT